MYVVSFYDTNGTYSAYLEVLENSYDARHPCLL